MTQLRHAVADLIGFLEAAKSGLLFDPNDPTLNCNIQLKGQEEGAVALPDDIKSMELSRQNKARIFLFLFLF